MADIGVTRVKTEWKIIWELRSWLEVYHAHRELALSQVEITLAWLQNRFSQKTNEAIFKTIAEIVSILETFSDQKEYYRACIWGNQQWVVEEIWVRFLHKRIQMLEGLETIEDRKAYKLAHPKNFPPLSQDFSQAMANLKTMIQRDLFFK